MKKTEKIILTILFSLCLLCTYVVVSNNTALELLEVSQKHASYIVQGQDIEVVKSIVHQHNGEITSELPIINGVAANLPIIAVEEIRTDRRIFSITPNHQAQTALARMDDDGDDSNGSLDALEQATNVQPVWDAGITGAGVTVAVLDTGLEEGINGLKENSNADYRIVAWQDFVKDDSSPKDKNGHGSHITGLLADSYDGLDGSFGTNEWNGIAPDVNLVVGRVLDKNGVGSYESVIQGIQWVVDNKDAYNIKILNLSLVANVQSPYWADPLNQAVTRAWAEGITVIVAAGNTGPDAMTVGVPGNNPYVITVGAFSDNGSIFDQTDDFVAPFSASGPTLDGFVKPDVLAPGAHMIATMDEDARLADRHEDYVVDDEYFEMSGTSQATAVVSGIAALMYQADPNLTPDQVKHRLMSTAKLWVDGTGTPLYSAWQQGMGRVDATEAVFSTSQEVANAGMDIQADLAGDEHYEGHTYYDENDELFKMYNAPDLPEEYTTWSGGYMAWAGGYMAWAGGYMAWAGGYMAWAGGYTTWSSGYMAWAGSTYSDPTYISSFIEGAEPENTSSASMVGHWVNEFDQGLEVHETTSTSATTAPETTETAESTEQTNVHEEAGYNVIDVDRPDNN